MSYGNSFQQRIYYNSPLSIKNLISSIYGYLQKKRRYGKFYHEYMNYLSKSQWFDNSKLEERQFEKTKCFLIHAKNNCYFYKNLFREYDFLPENIQSLNELNRLPIINKELVRNNLDKFLARNIYDYNLIWDNTSGTTGQGLKFAKSQECFERDYAFEYLHFSWSGIKRGDKIAVCAGHPIARYDQKSPPFWSYDYVNNWLIFSSYHLTEKNLPYYISELEKFQPDLLMGYPSSIYLLALANNNLVSRIQFKAVRTSSETLFDFQRKSIENSFNCKVFDYYGNGEMCGNIVECEKGNYHQKLEYSHIEILDKNNQPVSNGNEGRMICTAFGNYAMPLIRYDIGDVAVLSKKETCGCGRGGKIVEKIIGRTDDYILTSDGRFIGRLGHLFKNTLNVKLAQIIQNEIDDIIIRIVQDKDYTKKDENSILQEARFRLGPEIKIQFEYVKEIPRTKSGKHRFIVQNIKKKKLFDNIIDERDENQL